MKSPPLTAAPPPTTIKITADQSPYDALAGSRVIALTGSEVIALTGSEVDDLGGTIHPWKWELGH